MEPVSGTAEGLEEKMKKAICEMLTFFLFAKHEMYVNKVAAELWRLGAKLFLCEDPEIVGAVGAALFGLESLETA